MRRTNLSRVLTARCTARCLRGFLCVLLAFCASTSFAATISGPSTSSTGTFTLTWPSGYKLRTVNGSWQFNGATSEAFTNLPSGVYKFMLWTCWQEVEPGAPTRTLCAQDSTSEKTVEVTRDLAPVINTTTAAAGTMAYSVDVTLRGSASVSVPLRTLPGINGFDPQLSLRYDSARKGDVTDFYRADDTLGYGWHLNGASVITRCRGGLSGSPEPLLTTTDRLCLDGAPLLLVSGTYWSANAEYRTEEQSFIKVTNKGTWFEVRYPDGRVANFGDTADSQVVASGRFSTQATSGFWGANPVYLWAIRQVTNGFGDTMTYAYERFDPYGMVQLKSISYGGATVEFKYGPRADLTNVTIGGAPILGRIWRQSYLHTVLIRMNGAAVREYRLESVLSGGHRRLQRIQECGFDSSGTTATCLRPLQVGWTAVTGAASPISLTSLTDGLGATTEFGYTALSDTNNPLNYGSTTEKPFGDTIAVPNTGARAIAVVHEMKRSDGLTGAGRQRTTFLYKGLATASTLNRGFIGFFEVRAKDEQSGIHTYTQTRLDFPRAGRVSQIRQFTNAFPGGTELAREEHAFGIKVHSGVQFVYPLRSTHWIFEGSSAVGGSITSFTPCFRVIEVVGNTCPSTGTEAEQPTQIATTTLIGTGLTNPAFAPSVWGDVPDNRSVTGVQHTSDRRVNLHNTTTPWVAGAPIKMITTDTATGKSARTVVAEASYRAGTLEPETLKRFPDDPILERVLTRTFSGNKLTNEALSGAGFATRSTSYGPAFLNDRNPLGVTNAEGHVYGLGYDVRFGLASLVTDPDGNQSAVERDVFGRVTRVTEPDGTATETMFERCDVVSCSAVTGAVAAVRITVTRKNGLVQVAPTQMRYLDVRGRAVLEEVEALNSASGWRRQRTVYDNRSRVQSVSRPYFSTQSTPTCTGASTNCTYFNYDIRDRVTREDRPDLGFTTTTFTGATGSVTALVVETVKTPGASDVIRAKRSVFNVLGELTLTKDADGTGIETITTYTYDSHGNLDRIVVNGVEMATLSYDLARNRVGLTDANVGSWTFSFDGLGNLKQTIDAKGQITRYDYDLLDRLKERIDRYNTGNAVTNTWTWDLAAYGTGQLASRSRPGFSETYSYRSADSKLQTIQTVIAVSGIHNGTYTRTLGYDSAGRLASIGYPSGSTFTTAFNARGYPTQVKSGSTVLEEALDTDAFGQVTLTSFANALRTIRGYDVATGRLTSIQTGTIVTPQSVQDLVYQWRSNSTLYRRIDQRDTSGTGDDYTDTFVYDALERLTSQTTTVGASRTLIFGYDLFGNLTSKTSNVGGDLNVIGYQYTTSGKPHRLNQVTIAGISNTLTYDNNGSITKYDAATGDDIDLVYDGQNQVTSITVGTAPTARDQFWYDPDGQRFLGRETWQDAGTKTATTVYLGNFEEVIPAAGSSYLLVQRTQLGSAARHIRVAHAPNGNYSAWFEYVHRDHVGSVHVVTNASGVQLNDKLSFDPFGGRRRHTWASDIPLAELQTVIANEDVRFARGFTDHEQLNRTGFIHMNGRVYDSRIGRFVSADPIVQFPAFSQSYNRYSYVLNSPLSYMDPSGFKTTTKGPNHIEPPPDGGGFSRMFGGAAAAILSLFGAPPAIAVVIGAMVNHMANHKGGGGPTSAMPYSGPRGSGGSFGGIAGSAAGGYGGPAKLAAGSQVDAQWEGVVDSRGPTAATATRRVPYSTRYSSPEELLAALGKDGFVIGARPMSPLWFRVPGLPGSPMERWNVEVLHEHVFYVEVDSEGTPVLRDLGYFNDGRVRPDDDFPFNIVTYRFGTVLQGPITTNQLMSIPGFGINDYRLMTNNCQDFTSVVRRRYSR